MKKIVKAIFPLLLAGMLFAMLAGCGEKDSRMEIAIQVYDTLTETLLCELTEEENSKEIDMEYDGKTHVLRMDARRLDSDVTYHWEGKNQIGISYMTYTALGNSFENGEFEAGVRPIRGEGGILYHLIWRRTTIMRYHFMQNYL